MAFNVRCGKRITLSNGNRTAKRNITEFNHGLVLSSEPLRDDVLFEVRIDEKVPSWSGSIEVSDPVCGRPSPTLFVLHLFWYYFIHSMPATIFSIIALSARNRLNFPFFVLLLLMICEGFILGWGFISGTFKRQILRSFLIHCYRLG